jgi:hypothetical protein
MSSSSSSPSTSLVDRKRSRQETEAEDDGLQQHQEDEELQQQEQEMNRTNNQLPVLLYGVIACLSGFTTDKKEELHQLIESLGGRYVLMDVVCF